MSVYAYYRTHEDDAFSLTPNDIEFQSFRAEEICRAGNLSLDGSFYDDGTTSVGMNSADIAYCEHMVAAMTSMSKILDQIKKGADNPNWFMVGKVAAISSRLSEINEFLECQYV